MQVDSIVALLLGEQEQGKGQPAAGATVDVLLVTPPATDPRFWALSHVPAGNASSSSAAAGGSSAAGDDGAGSGGGGVVLTRSNANTARYAQCVRDIAQRRSLPMVDLFALTDVQQPGALNPYLCDGLHLSPAGNLLLYKAILAAINQHMPHLAISQLPLDAPYHADMTPENYRTLFQLHGRDGEKEAGPPTDSFVLPT